MPSVAGRMRTMAANTDFRKTAEQAQKDVEKMGSASSEALHDTYAATVQGAQDYTGKIVEFALANTNAVFDYLRQLSGVKSPTDFIELSNHHLRQQFETLSRQAQELAAIAQGMTAETANSIKSGVEKVRPLS
jgi:hypothetical protein